VDQFDRIVSLRRAAEFIKTPEPNIGDAYGIESVWGGGATVLTA
jgi:hypothetical protein